jgi:hypothetical protein
MDQPRAHEEWSCRATVESREWPSLGHLVRKEGCG